VTRVSNRRPQGTGNPFHYGSPVKGEGFTDRKVELDALVRRMLDGQNVILLSPRRYGKTSLLQRAMEGVRRRGGRTGYATLVKASDRREVAEALLAAVLAGPAGWLARRRTELARLLSGLRVQPTVTLQPSGAWQVTFGAAAPSHIAWEGVLEDTLRILAGVARSHPTSLVLDEFQRTAEIDAGLPGVFKAIADELDTVSLVFAGSKLHIMRELSTGPGAPLLGMGERISLDVIPESDMVDLLCKRAAAGGKPTTADVAADIYRSVDGVPNDVQKLAYAAFAAAGTQLDADAVSAGFAEIVSLEAVDFAELFEQCAPSQQRLLKALAAAPTSAVFSHDFLHRVDVANANSVRKAIDVLNRRELLRRRAEGWYVADPFFRSWLVS
jgi:uncharacterized protein